MSTIQIVAGATPAVLLLSYQLINYSHGRTGTLVRFVLEDGMAQEFAKAFYSSKAWQDCRNAYIKRVHYFCEDCLAKGIYSPAKYVHHIEELTPFNIHRPEIATGFDNLRAVCRACHDEAHDNRGRWAKVNEEKRKKKREAQRFTIDEFGRVTAKI